MYITNNSGVLILRFAVIFTFIACFGETAFAQEKIAVPKDSTEKPIETELENKNKEFKIFLDKIEIIGRIEKPQTFFILSDQGPIVDDIQIDRSFFKEIFRPIEKEEIFYSNKTSLSKKDYW